jgi:hypothetical protein
LVAISADRITCWEMLLIDAVSSSVAAATVSTFDEAWDEAVAAAVVCRAVSALLVLIVDERPCISPAATATASTIADLAREVGGELAPCRLPILLGSAFGFGAFGIGVCFRCTGGLGLRRLQSRRLEQLRELVGERNHHGGLDQEDDRVKDDPAKIGAAGIDRRRKNEVQHEVMQRDRNRAGDDWPCVAICYQTGQRGEEIHMHVDLPGMAG